MAKLTKDEQLEAELVEEFDELVHEEASRMASAINNGGLESQVKFLRENGWTGRDIRDRALQTREDIPGCLDNICDGVA